MCGIVGVIGTRPAAPLILDSLRRLEYRGYDSAGIATLVNGHIERRRAEGKLGNLAAVLDRVAAGRHHRHRPHALGDAWRADREQRPSARHVARVRRAQRHHREPRRAARRTRGSGAGVHHRDRHRDGGAAGRSESAARHGADRGGRRRVPPPGRRLCAGDDLRRPSRADRRRAARRAAGGRLRRGRDVRRLRRPGAGAADPAHRLSERRRLDRGGSQGRAVLRRRRRRSAARGEADAADRRGDRQGQFPPLHGKGAARASGGDRRHAASHGQSRRRARSRCPRCRSTSPRCRASPSAPAAARSMPAWSARWWFEAIARIPTDADVASEFRYRTPPLPKGGLGLLVSQSGETADTLAALRYMREQGQHVLSVVNVPESSMARESRRGAGDGGGAGDRRRQHQGVHRAACGAGLPGARAPARARGAISARRRRRR